MSTRKYHRYHPGDQIGDLTLIERMPGGQKWKCRCKCGEVFVTQISSGSKHCRKCAYEIISQSKTKHNEAPSENKASTRLYRIWTGIRNRCNNPNNHSYPAYGGRGIRICKEWDDYLTFKNWAISHGYHDSLSIDRIDNDGNYEPNNCRWVTQREQMRNMRNNHNITINGITMCVMDWCKQLGILKTNAYCNAKDKGITVDEYLYQRWLKKGENT